MEQRELIREPELCRRRAARQQIAKAGSPGAARRKAETREPSRVPEVYSLRAARRRETEAGGRSGDRERAV